MMTAPEALEQLADELKNLVDRLEVVAKNLPSGDSAAAAYVCGKSAAYVEVASAIKKITDDIRAAAELEGANPGTFVQ